MSGKIGNNPYRASGVVACAAGGGGAIDWCTTAKTSPFTASAGEGYFVNTCGGVITVTLPASPSAGDMVALKDYKSTWATACKKATLANNSEPINGFCGCVGLDTIGQSITVIYVDATQGWLDINDSTANLTGEQFLTATGGDAIVTCGDYKTHIFTGNGCFAVSSVSGTAAENEVDYVVVASGGGGNSVITGGGGAGGFQVSNSIGMPVASPLANDDGVTVTETTYPIVVGAAGAAACSCGGNVSSFATVPSAGGGAPGPGANNAGNPGGSGSGAAWRDSPGTGAGGSGNTPPTDPPQGENGGSNAPNNTSGGGGGAAAAGSNNSQTGGIGSYIADGFVGPTAPSYGSPGPVSNTRYFAGGGAGANRTGSTATAAGGGGTGGSYTPGVAGGAGCTNTGGGGGSGGPAGGQGGAGIVMIRYKYQ